MEGGKDRRGLKESVFVDTVTITTEPQSTNRQSTRSFLRPPEMGLFSSGSSTKNFLRESRSTFIAQEPKLFPLPSFLSWRPPKCKCSWGCPSGCSSGQQGALHDNASGSTFFKGKREVLRWPRQSGQSVTILKQLLQVVLYLEVIKEKLLLLNRMEYIKGIFAVACITSEIILSRIKSYTQAKLSSDKQMLSIGIEFCLTIHFKMKTDRAGNERVAQR